MQIGFVPQGRTVKIGNTKGKFLRMCGSSALVELEDGRRVQWSDATDVELLSDVEEVQENCIPRLEAELARLEGFTVGKYAQLGLKAETPCVELPKQLHPTFIRGALGEQPSDAVLCRRCNNRLCVRGEHLFWGTRSDCQRDMCLKGLARPSGKKVEVEQILLRITKLHLRLSKLRSKLNSEYRKS